MRNSLLHWFSAAALIVLLVNSPAAAEPRVLISSAADAAATWRYATDKPGDHWTKPDFEDRNWAQGKAGFGVPDQVAPPATIGTPWKTSEIWLRKTIDVGLGWAKKAGYNSLRVFVQYLVWKDDPEGKPYRAEEIELFRKYLPARKPEGRKP